MSITVNGKNRDTINLADRGLHYGDGLFETMRVHNSRVRLLDEHLERLLSGCERLAITPPARRRLEDEIGLAASERQEGVIKLIVTRGSGGRGYRPQVGMNATRVVMTRPLPPQPVTLIRDGGIRVGIAATRLARQPRLAGLKHLNRLEQVLACGEPGEFDERIMLDTEGNVVEGTMMNLFLVRNGALVTPDLSMAGVAGVMRRRLLALAASMGIAREVRGVRPEELERCDGIFMCNAVRGLFPVIAAGERTLPAGPVTRRLAAALAEGWP